jgi:hypothetical protein
MVNILDGSFRLNGRTFARRIYSAGIEEICLVSLDCDNGAAVALLSDFTSVAPPVAPDVAAADDDGMGSDDSDCCAPTILLV